MRKRIQINTGERFGKLVVIEEVASHMTKDKSKRRYFLCKCDCGNTKEIYIHSLIHGLTTSCGCKYRIPEERKNREDIKYPASGYSHSKLYNIYRQMIHRCYNPNMKCYRLYGERGIKVCDEWRSNFLSFYQWSMENGYKDELLPNGKVNKWSLDRIDVNGDYCPSNCRWTDPVTQSRNTRRYKEKHNQ